MSKYVCPDLWSVVLLFNDENKLRLIDTHVKNEYDKIYNFYKLYGETLECFEKIKRNVISNIKVTRGNEKYLLYRMISEKTEELKKYPYIDPNTSLDLGIFTEHMKSTLKYMLGDNMKNPFINKYVNTLQFTKLDYWSYECETWYGETKANALYVDNTFYEYDMYDGFSDESFVLVNGNKLDVHDLYRAIFINYNMFIIMKERDHDGPFEFEHVDLFLPRNKSITNLKNDILGKCRICHTKFAIG
jgi:hypothetical protein